MSQSTCTTSSHLCFALSEGILGNGDDPALWYKYTTCCSEKCLDHKSDHSYKIQSLEEYKEHDRVVIYSLTSVQVWSSSIASAGSSLAHISIYVAAKPTASFRSRVQISGSVQDHTSHMESGAQILDSDWNKHFHTNAATVLNVKRETLPVVCLYPLSEFAFTSSDNGVFAVDNTLPDKLTQAHWLHVL